MEYGLFRKRIEAKLEGIQAVAVAVVGIVKRQGRGGTFVACGAG